MKYTFFRIVNVSHKKREYMYLKLLESHREGGKIKHRQLINLSESVQLPSDRIKTLFEDLNWTLSFLKNIKELAPSSCRYLKASYLMALENAFKIEQRCREQDFRDILLRDWKRKHTSGYDETLFYDQIYKGSLKLGESTGSICWLENMNLFILDENGFPLRLIHREDIKGEEIGQFLLNLRIKEKLPEFFLGTSCEILYKTFRQMAVEKKESGYSTKEVFAYKQLTDWSGKATLSLDRILIMGKELSLTEEGVGVALMAFNSFKNQIEYVNSRITPITGGISMPEQDLNCTYFMSYLFKKLFDDIRKKHKI